MKLFDQKKSIFAREELEIEKLVREDDEKEKGLLFDDVVQEVKDKVEQTEEESESGSEPADDAAQIPEDLNSPIPPGERVTGDSEVTEPSSQDDMSLPENNPDIPEGHKYDDAQDRLVKDDDSKDLLDAVGENDEEIEEVKISAEGLRYTLSQETHQLLGYHVSSLEAYQPPQATYRDKPIYEYDDSDWSDWGRDKVSKVGDGSYSMSGKAWQLAKTAGKWLGHLGIKLGTDIVPKIAKNSYKGIVYAFDRLGYAFMAGFTGLEQYITRRRNSFDNLRSNIQKAQHALEILERIEPADVSDQAFGNTHAINQISIGESVDLVQNLEVANRFIHDAIAGLGVSIKEDIASIKELISHARFSESHEIFRLLEVQLRLTGMHEGAVPGFHKTTPLNTSYVSQNTLPGNTVFIASLPSSREKSREEWIQSYRDSEIILGINRSNYRLNEKIPYLTVSELKEVLKQLEAFCLLCIRHQSFYEEMKRVKLGQKVMYKNYFDSLIKEEQRISVKNSLIDLVTMKNNFIDKVYLPAAMDVHDYSARVINAYLRFAEKNIKALTP